MGNACAVARSPEQAGGGEPYSSVLLAWRFASDRHGLCSAEYVDFESLKSVSSRSCYGVLLVARQHAHGTPEASKEGTLSLSKLLSSVIDNLTPRGLNSEWKVADRGDSHLGESLLEQYARKDEYQCFSYVWVGRRSSSETRAYAMHQMTDRFQSLKSKDDMERLYNCGSDMLSSVFKMDADFSEFEQSIHLIRRRFGKNQGPAISDVKYKLFRRAELAVAPKKSKQRSLRRETDASGSEDDGEEASYEDEEDESSSGSSDESSSSSSSEELVVTPRGGMHEPLRERIVEPPTEGDDYSGGIISEFNMADDGGPEPDENEEIPADDAGHGIRVRFFDVRVSEITPQLYLGSATGARKRKWLQRRGITHVLNCATMILKNWWPDDFDYLSLYLLDGKREDVLCLVYDVLEWIDQAIESGHKVFVHCQQGVSRSTTMVVLYLMWKWKKSFREVSGYVKERRNVASPNPGFIMQLLMWEKRLFTPIVKPRLLLMAPQSTYVPDLIVPKLTTIKNPMTLMSNEVYILHSPDRLWIWTGKDSPKSYQDAALRVAPLMIKFENAPDNLKKIAEGDETEQFWLDLYGGEKPSPRVAPIASPRVRQSPGAISPASSLSPASSSARGPGKVTKLPSLKLGEAVSGSSAADMKRPASPVKLKLNLGSLSAAQKPSLNLNLSAVKTASPATTVESASSSESSSESDSSDETSESTDSSRDDDMTPPLVEKKPVKPLIKLRLSDLQPQRTETGPLSPLSNPSLRQSLGLVQSPKRSPKASLPKLTLEGAYRALENAGAEVNSVKHLSPDKPDSMKRASLSPPSKRGSLSNESSNRNSLSGDSSSTSPQHSPSNLAVHISPRTLNPRSIPDYKQAIESDHLDAVIENLYVGNELATDNAQLVSELGISDVINVCGGIAKAKKAPSAKTKTFFCDGDILCLVFLVISRIKEGKRVLIQGARDKPDYAPAFIYAYVMLEFEQSLANAETALKDRSPLMAPLSESVRTQLQIWEERLAGVFLSSAIRVYHVTKQSAKAPTLVVAKLVEHPNKTILKPTEVLIIHAETNFYLWSGKQHKYNTLVAAKKIAAQMVEFERIRLNMELLQQGRECNEFWKLLDSANLASLG